MTKPTREFIEVVLTDDLSIFVYYAFTPAVKSNDYDQPDDPMAFEVASVCLSSHGVQINITEATDFLCEELDWDKINKTVESNILDK